MKAIWNDTVIAESTDVTTVEGNAYFPLSSVNMALIRDSDTHTTCPWKGQASYFDLVVGDMVNKDTAWTYASPKKGAEAVAERVAFWRGVRVEE